MRWKHGWFVGALSLLFLLFLAALVGLPQAIRILGGVFAVLILPGLVWTAAVFDRPLPLLDRVIVILPVSLFLVASTVFIATQFGLVVSPLNLVLEVVAVTGLGVFIWLIRRWLAGVAGRTGPGT